MNQVHTCAPVNQFSDMTLTRAHENPYSLCRYYMLLLVLVKMSNAFDGHVICLRGTGCENNVFWLCTDEVCDILLQSRLMFDSTSSVKIINLLYVLPPLPSQLPTHMNVCGYGDSHTGRYRKEALHPRLSDPRGSWPAHRKKAEYNTMSPFAPACLGKLLVSCP